MEFWTWHPARVAVFGVMMIAERKEGPKTKQGGEREQRRRDDDFPTRASTLFPNTLGFLC